MSANRKHSLLVRRGPLVGSSCRHPWPGSPKSLTELQLERGVNRSATGQLLRLAEIKARQSSRRAQCGFVDQRAMSCAGPLM